MRRLPIYLLLDTSGSMSGDPIEALKSGISLLISSLRQNPYALETAYISIFEFNSDVKQLFPLTELTNITTPDLCASGMTNMGEALIKLSDSIGKDVVKSTHETKGDFKPMVFLITDGEATDDVEKGIKEFKSVSTGNVVAFAAGSNADKKTLLKITEQVYSIDTMDSTSMSNLFKWVSSSISVASTKIDQNSNTIFDSMPPPPEGINPVY